MTTRIESLRVLLVGVSVCLAAAAVTPVNAQEQPAVNILVEPQFTILDRGAGQPELQIFFGFNTQFVKN